MKRYIAFVALLILSIILIGCNQKKVVPIYKINQEVKFRDATKGSITLNDQSIKSNESVAFSFTLTLNEIFMFDELFSNYSISVDQTGIQLRYFNDGSTPTNLKNDYIVIINNVSIEIDQLSNYEFVVGESIVLFTFGSSYISNQDSVVSLTFTLDQIIPDVAFSF
ncbi:hypothetical protein [Acholeplasma laidlawii]|uniref:hypothetical protein n=1 Tax=Acholeplasma laidlawii TaxID=2148 RepID=UPI0021F6C256|nr:hypothetical protein [Acholeplasma laidlawii]